MLELTDFFHLQDPCRASDPTAEHGPPFRIELLQFSALLLQMNLFDQQSREPIVCITVSVCACVCACLCLLDWKALLTVLVQCRVLIMEEWVV